jgi:hypothetical protein
MVSSYGNRLAPVCARPADVHLLLSAREIYGMPRDEGTHDVAQVCLNGHVATGSYYDSPEFRQDYCEQCGTKTIIKCPTCEAEIRGHYRGGSGISKFQVPAFCVNCGNSFPWMTAKTQAAKVLVDEIEELSHTDKALFKASLDDIVADSPMTEVAVMRIKKLFRNVPQAVGEALKRATIEIASEAARKLLQGG